VVYERAWEARERVEGREAIDDSGEREREEVKAGKLEREGRRGGIIRDS
jgi:hypothetical protein